MRLPFQVYTDLEGNLHAMDGPVIELRTGLIYRTGVGGEFTHDAPSADYYEQTRANGAAGADFIGGSARNLVCAGGLASGLTGVSYFRPEVTDEFRDGAFHLVVTGASAATISDGVDVVAELTTGGTAPVGNYDLTTYGEDTYNASTPATLVITAEPGGPGAIPDATVLISAGSAMAGTFTAVDASNFVSAVDPDWTIELQPDGVGHLKYDGTVVAVRAEGTAFDPSGDYVAEATAYHYNPVEPEFDEEDDAPTANPFGILEITYSWPATPDLDTRTEFLGVVAGYNHSPPNTGGPVGDYMVWSGDDTSAAGSETVTIDLATAWDDGEISTFADIICGADWYPPSGGHGPATLLVTYDLGAGPVTLYTGPMYPSGEITPAATTVKHLRILAAGTLESDTASWTATVRRVAVPTRAGVAYITITEAAGVIDTVAGPFFATSQPANTTDVYHVPIGLSDGLGGIEQLITGGLGW